MDAQPFIQVEKPKCRYGSKCYRTNPEHKLKYSHPPISEEDSLKVVVETKFSLRDKGKTTTGKSTHVINVPKEPTDVVQIPPNILISVVIGKNFANVGLITKKTGARSVLVGKPGDQKINIFGSRKDAGEAFKCWQKLIAVAPGNRNIEKIYPKTDAQVQFFPAPEGIRILKRYQDPQILARVDNDEGLDQESGVFKTTVAKQLQKLTNHVGHIKMHAKFGKNIWYLVPDSLLGKRPADEIFKAIQDLPVKSFFSMGIAGVESVTDILEIRKAKETFNIKVLVKHNKAFESVLITVLVKDGMLRFVKAMMNEEKHITDQICLDKDVDIRLSLEDTKILTPDSPLLPTVVQFAQALQLKKDKNDENTIVLPTFPNIQVFRIQHKKRMSYILEEITNYYVDIINVRIFESEDKLLESNYKVPAEIPFEITPTEVEVSSQKWKRMFQFNKPNHTILAKAWEVQGVMATFPQFIKVVHDVAALLSSAAKKQ